MTLTESSRGLIVQGLRTKKQTRKWLAEKMGLDKSWSTRLFNGQIKSSQAFRRIMGLDDRGLKPLRGVPTRIDQLAGRT